MKREKQTTKDFYRHAETGDIYVIERRWDGTILGACPASEPLNDLDSYQCKPDNNLWIQEQSDKLLLLSEYEKELQPIYQLTKHEKLIRIHSNIDEKLVKDWGIEAKQSFNQIAIDIELFCTKNPNARKLLQENCRIFQKKINNKDIELSVRDNSCLAAVHDWILWPSYPAIYFETWPDFLRQAIQGLTDPNIIIIAYNKFKNSISDDWEVSWDETDANYMASGKARLDYTNNKMTASYLSKKLGIIPVHFMRKAGKGARVHIGEFRAWIKPKYTDATTIFNDELAQEYLADIAARKAAEKAKHQEEK